MESFDEIEFDSNHITVCSFQLPIAALGAITLHLHLRIHTLRVSCNHGQEQRRVRITHPFC